MNTLISPIQINNTNDKDDVNVKDLENLIKNQTTTNVCVNDLENLIKKNKYQTHFRKFLARIDGAIWGFAEGLASGALTGVNVTGAGGWIFGTIGQTFGAVSGALVGSFSGMIVGFLGKRNLLIAIFHDYRKYFGTGEKQVILLDGKKD